MLRNAFILTLTVMSLFLVGCSDNLTKDTAREVLEKEINENHVRYLSLDFEKGTPGFAFFEKLIADGSFEFVKKVEVFEPLRRKPMYKKIYKPKAELSGVFKSLVMRDELDISKSSAFDVMDEVMGGERAKIRETVVCEVQCRLKREDVQSIDEILNDEKSGKALVKFTLAEVPIAPYYDEIFKLADEHQKNRSWALRLKAPQSGKARFKKYKEGWRLEFM